MLKRKDNLLPTCVHICTCSMQTKKAVYTLRLCAISNCYHNACLNDTSV